MQREYRYSGPPSGVTLQGGREVLLWPRRAVELPDDHPYVRRLVARGLLTPVEAAATEPMVPAAAPEPDTDTEHE